MACRHACMRDGHSSRTPVARRLQQPTRTGGSGHRSSCLRTCVQQAARRPYSVLLPVGFAVPPALPPARCALTAPFHPCRGIRNAPRRSVLCGTFPRLAPAGCYPAPLVHGARTFLPGSLSAMPERPPGRLTKQGWVGPAFTSRGGQIFGVKAPRRDGAYPPPASSKSGSARSLALTRRRLRRRAPVGNGAGTR